MIEITAWTEAYLSALADTFGDRVWFVGLQGSYGRGEATESSDIDMVLILDELTPSDLDVYNAMLDKLPHRELTCGFLSGKKEILSWEPSDLFQFYFDTKPLKGSLDALLPLIDESAVARAIRIGACNIYHGCVHNMLHDKSGEILRGLYKSAVFVVQAICYRENGTYISHISDLIQAVSGDDRKIAETAMALRAGAETDFGSMSETLFTWAKNHIQ
jgi:predicted nucleotidyltransferase